MFIKPIWLETVSAHSEDQRTSNRTGNMLENRAEHSFSDRFTAF